MFCGESVVYSDIHSLLRFVTKECINRGKAGEMNKSWVIIMGENEKGKIRQKGKSDIFTLDCGSWKGLSGDEYECMKMKCLSQYRDSAGTQVTE